MPAVQAVTPGKLIIVGEYAVLDGGAAIATAVDVEAKALIAPARDEHRYIDPGSGETRSFRVRGQGQVEWLGVRPDFGAGVIECSYAAVAAHSRKRIGEPVTISLDTTSFYSAAPARQKLGLGSSAAVTTALIGGLFKYLGVDPGLQALAATCFAAHRQLQQGRGSGIDVLTALHGGVIGVRADDARGDDLPRVEPLSWPSDLYLLPVWSGAAASTMSLMQRLDASRQANPAQMTAHLERLRTSAGHCLSAWQAGRAGPILAAIEEFSNVLLALDRDSGIGIDTPAHQRIRLWAKGCGCVYKTSGAGGGDFGLAIANSKAAIDELRRILISNAIDVPALRVGSPGLRVSADAS